MNINETNKNKMKRVKHKTTWKQFYLLIQAGPAGFAKLIFAPLGRENQFWVKGDDDRRDTTRHDATTATIETRLRKIQNSKFGCSPRPNLNFEFCK